MPVKLEKRKDGRCYAEFCCNQPVHQVRLLDRSDPEVLRQLGATSSGPIPWGWCGQHKNLARSL